jgi:hypothetical protein
MTLWLPSHCNILTIKQKKASVPAQETYKNVIA